MFDKLPIETMEKPPRMPRESGGRDTRRSAVVWSTYASLRCLGALADLGLETSVYTRSYDSEDYIYMSMKQRL